MIEQARHILAGKTVDDKYDHDDRQGLARNSADAFQNQNDHDETHDLVQHSDGADVLDTLGEAIIAEPHISSTRRCQNTEYIIKKLMAHL